jgi:hypothetical protein
MRVHIETPCSENWDNMNPNEKGRFCNSCAKSVIDFTSLSIPEVIKTLEKSSGEVCGRLTSTQLKEPYFHFKPYKQSYIPYARVAANVMLIASAFAAQSCTAQTIGEVDTILPTQYARVTMGKPSVAVTYKNDTIVESDKKMKSIMLVGIIISGVDSSFIQNAKVEFITLTHIYSTSSDEKGRYQLEIPKDAINKSNVIRTTFDRRTPVEQGELTTRYLLPFKSEDYVLSAKQVAEGFNIEAQQDYTIMGGIGHYAKDTINPVVINNGEEVPYDQFQKSLQGEKSMCNLKGKPYYYFESRAAKALYGERARAGLYLFFDLGKVMKH